MRWVEESIHISSHMRQAEQFYCYMNVSTVHCIHKNNHQFISHSLWWRNFLFHLIFPRFKSKLVRRLASFSFIIRNCLTLGITVYTPCVALNIIAGIPYWASLTTMTLLTIMFTITVSQLNSEHTEVANGVAFECLHSQTMHSTHPCLHDNFTLYLSLRCIHP